MTSEQVNFSANWNYPTAVRVGAGRVRELAALCAQFGIAKPLVVTDRGTASLPFTVAIMRQLGDAGVQAALFDAVDSNPTVTNVEEGAVAFRSGGHDGVVALGGGSGLDAGKAIALYAGQDRPLRDFEDAGDNWMRVNEAGVAPVIAVPTTAGTGSEVGRASVITFPDTHEKKIIFHPTMLPVAVLSDPELTVGLPAGLTAATGLDAFTHCFEAYCAPGYHPMADGIALEGMRLIKAWLPVAYSEPGHIEARTHMLVAASMGATAFQKGLGAVHALSHPVGAFYGAHHGLANAVFLPYVMLRNRPAIAEKMARLGAFLGLENPGFDSVYEWVMDFRALFDIPNSAEVLGVREEDIPALAAAAEADPSMGGNPCPISREGLADLFQRALAGKLSPA
ncbi:iron-containing alcohol dehydrogenase [Kordiimonas lipolytica]|uniref:Iron-containing alcohol dehydrogenase n=1 Tax=Kordiimonas lipolytica TaxID=1662421 RepID=A0ABV8UFS7_9PROT|nr:iron-containing alcohol dehydrogenase [Kordiimonas lipolytica]